MIQDFTSGISVVDASALHGRLSDIEGMAIRKSLEMANGNKSKAAKLLGIGRATLYRKLKDLS